jgi:cytidine deaminase
MPDSLRTSAAAAARKAYAPHSGLYVGAALRSASGRIHLGCNVECGALPLGGCAERAALAAGVLAEGPAFRLEAMAVVAYDADGREVAAAPCGACRQASMEFGADCEVGFLDDTGRWRVLRLRELLPHAFVLP